MISSSLRLAATAAGRAAAAALVRTGLIYAALLAAGTAQAQTGLAPPSEAAPSPSASAPGVAPPARPTPRVTSPSDAQRSLELNNPQPEGKVTPQLRIPLGKKGDTPIFQRRGKPDGGAPPPSSATIDDSAARCDAQRGEQARTKCRDELSRQLPK